VRSGQSGRNWKAARNNRLLVIPMLIETSNAARRMVPSRWLANQRSGAIGGGGCGGGGHTARGDLNL
jgi:hypothetical protein